ncbi:MAG: response regulator [Candidatus Kaistia colombiensis]|nr:MAG: response regulator [Kaistia sp.]
MAAPAVSDPPPHGLVFVVDGDGAVRRSLRFALGIDGFAVETFGDAETFLRLAECRPDACVVVDYHLKGMNGVELIETVWRRGCRMPAILTVTNPSPALIRRAAAAGVALVEKPLLGSALLDRIREALAGVAPSS